MAPVAEGSNPSTHPNLIPLLQKICGRRAKRRRFPAGGGLLSAPGHAGRSASEQPLHGPYAHAGHDQSGSERVPRQRHGERLAWYPADKLVSELGWRWPA